MVCVCVCVCVSECVSVHVPSFSVLAAATFSPHTRETPDFLSCCKKLSPIDKRLLSSSLKRQKPVVCQKVRFEMLKSYSPSARLFEGIKMIEQVKIFKRYVGIFFILLRS